MLWASSARIAVQNFSESCSGNVVAYGGLPTQLVCQRWCCCRGLLGGSLFTFFFLYIPTLCTSNPRGAARCRSSASARPAAACARAPRGSVVARRRPLVPARRGTDEGGGDRRSPRRRCAATLHLLPVKHFGAPFLLGGGSSPDGLSAAAAVSARSQPSPLRRARREAAPERSSGKRQVGTPGYCGGGGREGGTRWKV